MIAQGKRSVTLGHSSRSPPCNRPPGTAAAASSSSAAARLVMGIVNVTPDSFSDGGNWFHAETDAAV